MNKDELRDLFEDSLTELDEFEKDIQKTKDLINLIIENFDLLKDDVTEEQIGDISSDISIKTSEIVTILKDLLSDSKKLQSFINEIKLLKRKREKKLNKQKEPKKLSYDEIIEELEKLKQRNKHYGSDPWSNPPNPQPYKPCFPMPIGPSTPYKPNRWDITF